MRKSASLLGYELGKTGRQMNELLKKHGYLRGEPGAYRLTEKGKKYGVERDDHRGVGGYSHYNRAWTFVSWEEEVLDALRDDMNNRRVASYSEDDSIEECVQSKQGEQSYDRSSSETSVESQGAARLAAWLTVGAVTLAAGIRVAPHAKRWWINSAAPGVKKAWRKVAGSETADDAIRGESLERADKTTEPGSGSVES